MPKKCKGFPPPSQKITQFEGHSHRFPPPPLPAPVKSQANTFWRSKWVSSWGMFVTFPFLPAPVKCWFWTQVGGIHQTRPWLQREGGGGKWRHPVSQSGGAARPLWRRLSRPWPCTKCTPPTTPAPPLHLIYFVCVSCPSPPQSRARKASTVAVGDNRQSAAIEQLRLTVAAGRGHGSRWCVTTRWSGTRNN